MVAAQTRYSGKPVRRPSWTVVQFHPMSALGQKQTCAAQKRRVRFTPNSDIDCVFRHVCLGQKRTKPIPCFARLRVEQRGARKG